MRLPIGPPLLQCVPEKWHVILNILFSCNCLLQWNLAGDIVVLALAIKRIHNLPPHLSYVSTLPDITQQEALLSQRRRDASSLSVDSIVGLQYVERKFRYRFTAAYLRSSLLFVVVDHVGCDKSRFTDAWRSVRTTLHCPSSQLLFATSHSMQQSSIDSQPFVHIAICAYPICIWRPR